MARLVYAADTPRPKRRNRRNCPVRFATPSALDSAAPGNTVLECTGSPATRRWPTEEASSEQRLHAVHGGPHLPLQGAGRLLLRPRRAGRRRFDLYGSTDLSSYYDYLTFVAGIQARSLFDTGVEVGDESHFLTVTTQSDENGALLCITGRLVEDGEAEVLNAAAITAAEPLLTAAQYQSKGQPMPTVSALMRTSVERYAQQSAATQAARKNSGTARDDTADAADLAQRADELQNITDSLLASTDKMLKGLTDVAGSTNAVETDLNKGAEGTLPEQTVTVDQIKVTATPAPTDAPTPEPTEAPASDANSEPTPTEAPTQAPQPDNSTGTEGETINVTMNGTAQTMDLVRCLAMVAQNELGPNAPAEAYKAQCVATHCWILSQSGYPSVLGAEPGAAALAAAQEVAHVLVTYNGQVCFTPYFASASTGTASSAEVWAVNAPGCRPWTAPTISRFPATGTPTAIPAARPASPARRWRTASATSWASTWQAWTPTAGLPSRAPTSTAGSPRFRSAPMATARRSAGAGSARICWPARALTGAACAASALPSATMRSSIALSLMSTATATAAA